MQNRPTGARQAPGTSTARTVGIRLAVIGALVLLCSAVLPVLPIFCGGLLIVAAAIHAGLPELRPLVDPVLRVPVGRAGKRHAHLLLMAGVGVLLVGGGSVGATMRGRLSGEWEQRERRRELAEGHVTKILERARHFLSVGDVGAAELVLLEADAFSDVDADTRAEIDGLLERVRRSGDPDAILAILTRLPQEEFEAFQQGASMPQALEFGERVLTYRAVEVARAQLDEARRARARR
jgi:hypothetical protein